MSISLNFRLTEFTLTKMSSFFFSRKLIIKIKFEHFFIFYLEVSLEGLYYFIASKWSESYFSRRFLASVAANNGFKN